MNVCDTKQKEMENIRHCQLLLQHVSAANSRIKETSIQLHKPSVITDPQQHICKAMSGVPMCTHTITHPNTEEPNMGSSLASDPHQMLPFTVYSKDTGSIANWPTAPTSVHSAVQLLIPHPTTTTSTTKLN